MARASTRSASVAEPGKPILEIAPFPSFFSARTMGSSRAGAPRIYYVAKSARRRMLIAAILNAGLVSLMHTPSPMRFLNDILGRPSNVSIDSRSGYPADDVKVPKISKKTPRSPASTELVARARVRRRRGVYISGAFAIPTRSWSSSNSARGP